MTNSYFSKRITTTDVPIIMAATKDDDSSLKAADFNIRSSRHTDNSEFVDNNKIDLDEIVNKVLGSDKIQDMLKSYKNLNEKIDVTASLDYDQQDKMSVLNEKHRSLSLNLKEEIDKIRLMVQQVEHRLINRCCSRRNLIGDVEFYVMRMLKDIFSIPEHIVTEKDVSNWLRTMFVAKEDLEIRVDNLTKHLNQNFDNLIAANTKRIMEDVTSKIGREITERYSTTTNVKLDSSDLKSLSEERIKRIVLDSLKIYDADKTGLVDYAMEPSGGQIISTRCTESYSSSTAVISILGIPIWHPVNSPRTVITPRLIKPGECWAFQNFPGYLIIKLVQPLKIEMFSYEHISRLLVPDGKITSAPKEFTIYGLKHEEDRESVEIAHFTYDQSGEPLQYFPVKQNGNFIFHFVELVIKNNHGNPNYTCMYRFRVHGTPVFSASTEPT